MDSHEEFNYEEKIYENKRILSNCMRNSYDFLMGNKTLDEILDQNGNPYFLWNVIDHESLTNSTFNDVLDIMIRYYEDDEEYEKCAKLLKFKINEKDKHREKVKETYRVGKEGV